MEQEPGKSASCDQRHTHHTRHDDVRGSIAARADQEYKSGQEQAAEDKIRGGNLNGLA
jgi:hypothetical protein